MSQLSNKTSALFVIPSFLSGFSRVLDLGSTYQPYNLSEMTSEADSLALKSDWMQVGDDLRVAMEKYAHRSR